jgi:hypothetical protein
LVNRAPIAIAKSMVKPIFLVFAKHISTKLARISGIPFSPNKENTLQKKLRKPQFIFPIAVNTALSKP